MFLDFLKHIFIDHKNILLSQNFPCIGLFSTQHENKILHRQLPSKMKIALQNKGGLINKQEQIKTYTTLTRG